MACASLTPSFLTSESIWYPPEPRTKPSLKDYVTVKHRLRPPVLDTHVYRGDLVGNPRLVVVSLRLKLKRKVTQKTGNRFEVELLKEAGRRLEYMESICKCFEEDKEVWKIGRKNCRKQ